MAQGTTIGPDVNVVTFVVEFNVEPAQMDGLVSAIKQNVEDIVRHQAGFVSHNLHASADGQKVLNYFQFESQDALSGFLGNTEAQQKIMSMIGQYGPHGRVYQVVSATTA